MWWQACERPRRSGAFRDSRDAMKRAQLAGFGTISRSAGLCPVRARRDPMMYAVLRGRTLVLVRSEQLGRMVLDWRRPSPVRLRASVLVARTRAAVARAGLLGAAHIAAGFSLFAATCWSPSGPSPVMILERILVEGRLDSPLPRWSRLRPRRRRLLGIGVWCCGHHASLCLASQILPARRRQLLRVSDAKRSLPAASRQPGDPRPASRHGRRGFDDLGSRAHWLPSATLERPHAPATMSVHGFVVVTRTGVRTEGRGLVLVGMFVLVSTWRKPLLHVDGFDRRTAWSRRQGSLP